jgi:hypothetical protein
MISHSTALGDPAVQGSAAVQIAIIAGFALLSLLGLGVMQWIHRSRQIRWVSPGLLKLYGLLALSSLAVMLAGLDADPTVKTAGFTVLGTIAGFLAGNKEDTNKEESKKEDDKEEGTTEEPIKARIDDLGPPTFLKQVDTSEDPKEVDQVSPTPKDKEDTQESDGEVNTAESEEQQGPGAPDH